MVVRLKIEDRRRKLSSMKHHFCLEGFGGIILLKLFVELLLLSLFRFPGIVVRPHVTGNAFHTRYVNIRLHLCRI